MYPRYKRTRFSVPSFLRARVLLYPRFYAHAFQRALVSKCAPFSCNINPFSSHVPKVSKGGNYNCCVWILPQWFPKSRSILACYLPNRVFFLLLALMWKCMTFESWKEIRKSKVHTSDTLFKPYLFKKYNDFKTYLLSITPMFSPKNYHRSKNKKISS